MDRQGLIIAEISEQDFREFAKRFATSPEIGPIETSLDKGTDKSDDYDRILVGLWGCEKLCAAACFHLYRAARDESRRILKLDSVVVDSGLRRRGLAAVLVSQAFGDLVRDTTRKVVRIYAHSVHPATVRLLRRLRFNDPQATGAPISDISLDGEARGALLVACEDQLKTRLAQMRLQCAFCRKRDKRARPWCLSSDEMRRR